MKTTPSSSRGRAPVLIGIGGGHSSSGKTTLGCALLRSLEGWGAIKCSPDELYVSVVDDMAVLSEPGTDTAAYISAGASDVLWVQGPREELAEAINMAAERLSHLPGIMVEGNHAIEVLNPDIVIFIFGSAEMFKPSALPAMSRADVLVSEGPMPQGFKVPDGAGWFQRDNTAGLIEHVQGLIAEVQMEETRLMELLKERSKEGRITCAEAWAIAEELGAKRKDVGEAADALGIRITNCQLGCF